MPIILAIAAVAAVGVNAYNAYAQQDYQDNLLKTQRQALLNQGILTDAEKRVAEAQINALTKNLYGTMQDAPDPASSVSTVNAGTSTTGPPGLDFTTLLLYGGALLLGWIMLKAILKST